MKKLIILIAVLMTTSASAEWTYSTSQKENGNKSYIDYKTIESNKGLVYAWTMTDFVRVGEDGVSSVKVFYAIDCGTPKQYNILSFHAYSSPMAAKGLMASLTPEDPWEYLIPGSVVDQVASDICTAI